MTEIYLAVILILLLSFQNTHVLHDVINQGTPGIIIRCLCLPRVKLEFERKAFYFKLFFILTDTSSVFPNGKYFIDVLKKT